MIEQIYGYFFDFMQSIGYRELFLMMLIEASMLPFPSEIPLMAIGIQASHGEMNLLIGMAISLLAIAIGATINYTIGYYIGDPFFEKYGKYFFIKKRAYHEAKKLFEKNEKFYTLYGRLIPLVRQLMSLPAGIVHMPYLPFITLTLLGSALWHSIMIGIGYFLGDNIPKIKEYLTYIHLILVTIGGLYLIIKYQYALIKIVKKIKNTISKIQSKK